MSDRITQFQELLAKNPLNDLLWYGLGRELVKNKRLEEAADAFQRCLAANPNYTTAYRELGSLYIQLGQNEEAKPLFNQGLKVAEQTGDLQVKKEIAALLARLTPPAG